MNKDLNVDIGVDFKKEAIKESLINFIVPLVSLAAIGLVGFFVLYPSYQAIPGLQDQIQNKTNLKNQLSKKLENLNNLVDFKRAVDENSELVNTVLVSEELVPALLTQVDKIVKSSGMEISKLSYTLGGVKPKEGAEYNVVTVNLNTQGTFLQLVNLLESFENTARMVNVDTVRYSRKDDEEAGESVSATFVLQSPYLYVESSAVTDEPIDLDISSTEFTNLINKIKDFDYFDPFEVDKDVPVVVTEEEVDEDSEGAEGGSDEPDLTGEDTKTEDTTTEDVGIFGTSGDETDVSSEDTSDLTEVVSGE